MLWDGLFNSPVAICSLSVSQICLGQQTLLLGRSEVCRKVRTAAVGCQSAVAQNSYELLFQANIKAEHISSGNSPPGTITLHETWCRTTGGERFPVALAPESRKARLEVQRSRMFVLLQTQTLDTWQIWWPITTVFSPFPGRGQGRKSQCQIWDDMTKCQSLTVARGENRLSTPQAGIAVWDTAGLLWPGPCPPQGTRAALETPKEESLCSWQWVQAIKPMTCLWQNKVQAVKPMICLWQNKCSPLSVLSSWARRSHCVCPLRDLFCVVLRVS